MVPPVSSPAIASISLKSLCKVLPAALKPEQYGYDYNEYGHNPYNGVNDVVQLVLGVEFVTDRDFTMLSLALAVVVTVVSNGFVALAD